MIQNTLGRYPLLRIDVYHLREEVQETRTFYYLIIVHFLQRRAYIPEQLFLGFHYISVASLFAAQDTLTNLNFPMSCCHFAFQGEPDWVPCHDFDEDDAQRPNVV